MKKKSMWRAKLMARMARDGDVEGLAEIITEMMEEPAPVMAVNSVPADPVLPAGDPLVNAVASAVAENLEPVTDEEIPTAEAAPVVVETPVEQPVVIDCGAEILEALQKIISLLSGPVSDCGPEAKTSDEDLPAVTEAVVETKAEELAENVAAAAAEAMAETLEPELASDGDEESADPVEALVAEILDSDEPQEEAPGEEILSGILEPEEAVDEDDPEALEKAADALRAAVAAFRPQLKRMTPKQRQRFNADVAARMKRLSRKQKAGKPGAYAALRQSAARDREARSLGERIMAQRNANLRK